MWSIIVILVTICSAAKQPLRIYGGIDANPDEYPYVVRIEIQRHFRDENNSIIYDQEHLCTASALSSVWVLSASHCITNLNDFYEGSPYQVEKLIIRHGHVEHLPGIHDSFSDVLFTIAHPLYTPLLSITYNGIKKMLRHDIGLFKTNPMRIRTYAKLSAVDYKSFNGYEAVIAGFGITTQVLPDGKIETDSTLDLKKPLQLLKALITKCDESYLGLCIASRCDQAASVCGGDSGGPLLHPSGVIGVLSQGPESGFCLDAYGKETSAIAGYVTPVTPYIEWIYNTMKN